MMKKILLLGSGGQLGYDLFLSAPRNIDLHAYDRARLNICDIDTLLRIANTVRPDFIINAAAYTNVDRAEIEEDLACAVNSNGAENCAKVAEAVGAKLIHISTNFVFDGYSSSPYKPEDTTFPINVYGQTKANGEDKIQKVLNDKYIIFRTSWLYGSHGNNFVKMIIRLLLEKTELSVVDDQIGSPTYSLNLANAIWKSLDHADMNGIYHWSDMGTCSRHELSTAIQDLLYKSNITPLTPIAIKPIMTEQYKTLANRPLYSVLDCTKTYNLIGPGEHWKVALNRMLGNYLNKL